MPDLITLGVVRSELAIDAKNHDDQLQVWIGEASKRVTDICRQPIIETEMVVRFDGTGRCSKVLAYHPVASDATLEERTSIESGWSEYAGTAEVSADGSVYVIETSTVLVRGQQYRATITVGYPADQIPAIVKEAAMLFIMQRYLDSPIGEKRAGVKSRAENGQVGGTFTTSFESLDGKAIALLAPYTVRDL